MGLSTPLASPGGFGQLPVSIMNPRMATITAMVNQEATLIATPIHTRTCLRASQRCQVRKKKRISPTSVTNTIHSVNQAQKKTRMRLPIAAGLISEAHSQMPTPVSAPSVVVMMKHTARTR